MKPKYCMQHPDRIVHARGRCKSCYVSIRRLIDGGSISDRQAVKLGYFLPLREDKKKK